MDFIGPCLKQNGSHLSLRFKLTSTLFVPHQPWNNAIRLSLLLFWTPAPASRCSISDDQASMIASTAIGRHTSFPSQTFNFMEGWENAASPCYLPRSDNSTVCSLCRLSCFNKQLARCSLYRRFPPCLARCDKQLNGVTVNRGSSFALLWQHFIWCGSASPRLPRFLPSALFVDLARRGSHRCHTAGEANWHDLKVWRWHTSCHYVWFLYLFFSLFFFPPLMPFQHACTHTKRDVSIFLD